MENFCRHSSLKDSEKALMVLINSEGKFPPQIARAFKRHRLTGRDLIKCPIGYDIKGFNRKFSAGLPKEKNKVLSKKIFPPNY